MDNEVFRALADESGRRLLDRLNARNGQSLRELCAGLADNAFVYTTYISTTPERLWQALTEPAFMDRYWGSTFESELTPRATMVWHYKGATMADPEQVILEADPYRRLAYTWHTFTPEWAEAVGFDDEQLAAFTHGPRSRVSFEIEETGNGVKLTVVHDGFQPGSPVLESISGGWPMVLSSLKTLLEAGEPALASG